jgi:phospholipid-binding lipoprotein MlaA
MSLREATEKAMEENIGFRAVEITPRLDDGTPRAKIVLNRGEEFREISQDLGLIEKPAEDSKEDAAVDADIARADPWKPFNQKTFWFNLQIDRFVFRPVATVYNAVLPGPVRQGIGNALDNLNVTRRLVNNILQLKFEGAGRELSRFVINSSVGLVGLFDVADTVLGIRQSKRDTGQTLGVYGIGAGPYLVLPFLPPLTVRDFFGFVADEAMEPWDYFVPLASSIAIGVTGLISDRAADIDSFWGVEETTPDLYGTVRDAYLQRREFAVRK